VPSRKKPSPLPGAPLAPIQRWLAAKQWKAFAFQQEAWAAYLAGKSGLVHAPTGFGKTLAVWLGPVAEGMQQVDAKPGLQVLWITPLRALAVDTARALQEPLAELGSSWLVGSRTGDTSASQKAKLKKQLPQALVTTPESLSLMLTQAEPAAQFAQLKVVIVDEWHELMASKRGVQTELCLARLRRWCPGLRIWGVSATIGNLEEAMQVLLGPEGSAEGCVVHCSEKKQVEIETLLPEDVTHFPWSGHLGREMAGRVIEKIESAKTTLLFTNTRSQTEIWYQTLSELRPDLIPQMAMHHGSLDKEERESVEQRLREGAVRCVVCTSSLDLGVDFSPVEQVIQLGSPKGIARILQRAGRSGHQPGATSRVLGVPTNAFELVEFAAARDSLAARKVERRVPIRLALDVLVQHLISVSIGGGFRSLEMQAEVRSTYAYAELTDAMWEWCLIFITKGGRVLQAYPDYHKVVETDGTYHIAHERLARNHRMSIGTISSDPAISVRYASGRRLGTVEEWFISKINPGGQFIFSGRRLELIRTKDMVAQVKDATKSKKSGQIPSWQGGKSPLSTELAQAVARKLMGEGDSPEMQAVSPILAIQAAWSRIPQPGEVLIEQTRSREGSHAYVYPFAGRVVHEGIATLLAHRLSQVRPLSIRIAFNDYGFELATPGDLFRESAEWKELLSPERLAEDLAECINTHELARRQFRQIARVAGLIVTGFPGSPKAMRSIQASSGLLFDTMAKYDPENMLLEQARREILESHLDFTRLQSTLLELYDRRIVLVNTRRLTPMAFPLWADNLTASFTSETFAGRLAEMLEELEIAAQNPGALENRPELG
jgi:ATP-dependent helicase Lhr and Lhr-like helicase